MGFSEKIQRYWKEKGLNNKDISKIMDGYSEALISRYNNQDKISATYIEKIAKYFPDAPIEEFIKTDENLSILEESRSKYKKRTQILIEEIEERLKELKSNLSRI